MVQHERLNIQFKSRIRGNDCLPNSCDSHFHSVFEYLYVLEGSFELTLDGMTETLKAGDSALMAPYLIHSFGFDMSKPFRFWIVSFSGYYINSFIRLMENQRGCRIAFQLSPEIDAYVSANLLSKEANFASDPLQLKSCLYAICSEYLKKIPLKKRETKDSPSLVAKISDYMNEHYMEEISLKSLSKELGYSYSYLSHGFHQLFNLSFNTYLNLYRIDRAEILLLSTDLPVTEVAENSGFSSIRNFNYVFRNHYGISPREYRKIKGAIL